LGTATTKGLVVDVDGIFGLITQWDVNSNIITVPVSQSKSIEMNRPAFLERFCRGVAQASLH
jgi:hypothetical protein